MGKTIHLEPKMVPAHLRGTYAGKKFTAIVTENVHIPASAGIWDGGSRTTYSLVRLSDGGSMAASENTSAPWDNARQSRNIALIPGVIVVEHRIFRGADMGLTFYVHPQDTAAMLPAPVDLTVHERFVLEATRSYKSSYGGMDRYEMATRDAQYRNKFAPTRDEWNATKEALIKRGYLNKSGAITTAGRNAIG
jgi:hypothetical protein